MRHKQPDHKYTGNHKWWECKEKRKLRWRMHMRFFKVDLKASRIALQSPPRLPSLLRSEVTEGNRSSVRRAFSSWLDLCALSLTLRHLFTSCALSLIPQDTTTECDDTQRLSRILQLLLVKITKTKRTQAELTAANTRQHGYSRVSLSSRAKAAQEVRAVTKCCCWLLEEDVRTLGFNREARLNLFLCCMQPFIQ